MNSHKRQIQIKMLLPLFLRKCILSKVSLVLTNSTTVMAVVVKAEEADPKETWQ